MTKNVYKTLLFTFLYTGTALGQETPTLVFSADQQCQINGLGQYENCSPVSKNILLSPISDTSRLPQKSAKAHSFVDFSYLCRSLPSVPAKVVSGGTVTTIMPSRSGAVKTVEIRSEPGKNDITISLDFPPNARLFPECRMDVVSNITLPDVSTLSAFVNADISQLNSLVLVYKLMRSPVAVGNLLIAIDAGITIMEANLTTLQSRFASAAEDEKDLLRVDIENTKEALSKLKKSREDNSHSCSESANDNLCTLSTKEAIAEIASQIKGKSSSLEGVLEFVNNEKQRLIHLSADINAQVAATKVTLDSINSTVRESLQKNSKEIEDARK